jgi:2-polyprenyl-6-methoxyphenol hydroxylase-like FAD-dependent oxidoreductase
MGVKSTVSEKAEEADEWNSKSYTIVIGERGCAALEKANVLGVAREAGNARRFVYFFDGQSGATKTIPKATPGIGFTRPSLVSCLEKVARSCPNVTIQRGAAVSHVTDGDELQVVFKDGTNSISATHIIGADGKWSKVRESFPSLSNQARMQTVPSFGVHMNAKSIDGFQTDGTYVIRPSNECMFYIIAAPRENDGEGFSISMVCYDETLQRYPWLEPPSESSGGWEDEYSAVPDGKESNKSLTEHLETLFREELPAFYAVLDKNAFQTARVNRRVTWIEMKPKDGNEISYATNDGRVALIGDAIHAMAPSMGEGCNCALESAARLVESVQLVMERKGESDCTIESLNEGFAMYGTSRPKEVIPIQEQSAARSCLKKNDNARADKSTAADSKKGSSTSSVKNEPESGRGQKQLAQ